MDATQTANRKQLSAVLAVVFGFVWSAAPARAELLVRTPADERPAATHAHAQFVERAGEGIYPAGYASYEQVQQLATAEDTDLFSETARAKLLALLLMIPPLVEDIPLDKTNASTVVENNVGLNVQTQLGGTQGSDTLHTKSVPEPASLLLGMLGSGLAAVGVWYRRRSAGRKCVKTELVAELVGD